MGVELMKMDGVMLSGRERVRRTKDHPFKNPTSNRHTKKYVMKCTEETFK